MYICICNPFTDNDVQDHLDSLDRATRTADVYASCSGGESMNCGTCACALKKMVDTHNSKVAVKALIENIAAQETEAA